MAAWTESLCHNCLLLVSTVWLTLNRVDSAHFTGNVTIQDTGGTGSPYDADHVAQYVLYHGADGSVTWNEARATCQALGGDLAKIETAAKKLWIEGLAMPGIFDTDVWTGLSESVAGSRGWVSDCVTADPSLPDSGVPWSSSLRCFTLLSGTFNFVRQSCMETNDFICEVYTAVTVAACNVHITVGASEIPDDSCVSPATCAFCFCEQADNTTTEADAQAIADEIVKNLTVDAKSTSAHRRTLESAEDHRASAKSVGFVGVIFVIIPFGIMIVLDVKTMAQGVVNIRYIYRGGNLRLK